MRCAYACRQALLRERHACAACCDSTVDSLCVDPLRSLRRGCAQLARDAPASSLLRMRRHRQIEEELKNGSYVSPVTPAFKRCQVLLQAQVSTGYACEPNPASLPAC